MTLRKRLWDVAVDQYGFVTTADAHALDVDAEELARLHRRGKLERAGHGIYRFTEFPITARDEYMLATLWPGVPEAALSHDTALAVYELCDINPDRIHLTISVGRRVRRAGGEGYVVHRQNLNDRHLGWWQGIRAVTEHTAIEQGIASGVPVHLLADSIASSRRRGRITDEQERKLRTAMERTLGT